MGLGVLVILKPRVGFVAPRAVGLRRRGAEALRLAAARLPAGAVELQVQRDECVVGAWGGRLGEQQPAEGDGHETREEQFRPRSVSHAAHMYLPPGSRVERSSVNVEVIGAQSQCKRCYIPR